MKNQRNLLQTMKQHGRGIATATLLVGTLILPWNAAEAESSAIANLNHDEYSDPSIGAPSEQMNLAMLSQGNAAAVNTSTYPVRAPRAAVQLFSDMPLYGLQTNAFAPTFLLNHAPDDVNQQKSEFTVNNDGSWAMFSW